MVNTSIKHITIMRNQDKSLLFLKVTFDYLPSFFIKMICWFIYQKEIVAAGE